MKLTSSQIREFQKTLWDYYSQHSRDLPWRQTDDPYKILVSEIMLQQTQVARVIPKYREFIQKFSDIKSLANAELGDVLITWSGLGYNRRAKFLWQTAKEIQNKYDGVIPQSIEELVEFPGIGENTAGAIMTYSFNRQALFIETNIRTVYIYHFFNDTSGVHDRMILELLQQTLPRENRKDWYWALMDYGTFLKQAKGNNINQAKHYIKQSAFTGSVREIRGTILRLLTRGDCSIQQLQDAAGDERLGVVLEALKNEGLISQQKDTYSLY